MAQPDNRGGMRTTVFWANQSTISQAGMALLSRHNQTIFGQASAESGVLNKSIVFMIFPNRRLTANRAGIFSDREYGYIVARPISAKKALQ
jgi:hypothetical protein